MNAFILNNRTDFASVLQSYWIFRARYSTIEKCKDNYNETVGLIGLLWKVPYCTVTSELVTSVRDSLDKLHLYVVEIYMDS